MYCYQCGAKIPDGSTFCPECGVKLARANKKGGKSSAGDTKNDRIIAKAQQLQSGDATAFDELYNLTHDRIYYLALKITQNREDALEAVQETYLSVYRKIEGLSNPAVFRAWISKIVVNKCMDLLGKQTEYLTLDSREEGEEDIFDRMEESGSNFIPHEALDQEETRNMMMSLIDRLPDLQRITLLLYYYQQLGVNEIAAVMDCPVATVKSRLQYARKQIKQGVEEYEVQGVKLYGFGSGPGLVFALKELAKYNTLPSADASHILSLVQHTIAGTAPGGGVLSPSGNPAQPPAHVGAPHTGGVHTPITPKSGFFGKIAHASLSKKIIAGVVTLAIAGTAGFVVPHLVTPHQNAPAVTTETDSTDATKNQDNTVGNTPSNLMNNGYATMQNDTIYYVEYVDTGGCNIRSMGLDGENDRIIYTFDGLIMELNVIGDQLYFIADTIEEGSDDNADESMINVLDLDDLSVKTIYQPSNYIVYLCVTKNKMYFQENNKEGSDTKIYSANLDAGEITNIVESDDLSGHPIIYFAIVDSSIYYCLTEDDGEQIYRCDLYGNNKEKINFSSSVGNTYHINYIDDSKIYYDQFTDIDGSAIFSMNLDGSNATQIATGDEADSFSDLNLAGNKLYFTKTNFSDQSQYYYRIISIDIDGSDEKNIINSDGIGLFGLSVCGHWLFYYDNSFIQVEKIDLNDDSE